MISRCDVKGNTRLVWDVPVRVTHWLLVLAVSGSYLTSRSGRFVWHTYCGYAVMLLSMFKIAWGFVGTRHARFTSFLYGPQRVWRYALKLGDKSPRESTIGHNPLGGWSILCMLILLVTQACSGLAANDGVASAGPLYGWVSNRLSDALTAYHHAAFKSLAALVALHLLAIGYYGVIEKTNLLLPMITGRKSSEIVPAEQGIDGSRSWWALLIMLILAGTLAGIVALAPKMSLSIF